MQTRQITIDISAENHNPTILNPDFLKYNGIVGADWELADDPVCASPFARVRYTNGIWLSAHLNELTIRQTDIKGSLNPDGNMGGVIAPAITSKYVEALPQVAYDEVNTTFLMYMPCKTQEEAEDFISSRFIKDGPWKELQPDQQRSTDVRFRYTTKGHNAVVVSIQYAEIGEHDDPVVDFEFVYHRHVEAKTPKERVDQINLLLRDWHRDFDNSKKWLEQLIGRSKV